MILLANNQIEFVDDQAFDFTIIRRLNLEGNKIAAFKWQPFDNKLYRFVWNNNSTYVIEASDMSTWDTSFQLDASNNSFVNSSDFIRTKTDQIDFQNNGLLWLPIYPQTTKLEAQNNRISQIVFEEETYGNRRWGPLEYELNELNLSNNSLTYNSLLGLSKLTALREIDLSYNHIESLTARVFSRLYTLKRITLSNNKLKYVNPGAFFDSFSLEYLDVSSNHLKSFRLNNIFAKLTELKINDNNLTVLDTNIKRVAPKLSRVSINGNNWTCDHLVSALPLIPFDQIEFDVSYSLRSWLEGDNIHGHVKGIPCFNEDAPSVAEDGHSSAPRASDVAGIDVKAKVEELLAKFEEMNKRLEVLSNHCNSNNNV